MRYSGATNYEGVKILVYDAAGHDVLAQRVMDPHFCEGDHLSPIARFKPTAQGMRQAVRFAKLESKHERAKR